MAGIDGNTVRHWKNRAPWWNEAVNHVQKQFGQQFEAKITGIQNQILIALKNRISKGDEVITKDGDRLRKEVGAKELAGIYGILEDKKLRAKGLGITDGSDPSSILKKIEHKMEDMAKEMDRRTNEKVVSDQ